MLIQAFEQVIYGILGKLLPAALYYMVNLVKKYIYLSAPVIIGKDGWEKIIDFDLTADEQAAFNKSAEAVRSMNDVLKTL